MTESLNESTINRAELEVLKFSTFDPLIETPQTSHRIIISRLTLTSAPWKSVTAERDLCRPGGEESPPERWTTTSISLL